MSSRSGKCSRPAISNRKGAGSWLTYQRLDRRCVDPAVGLPETDPSRGFIPGNLRVFGFPRHEYAEHPIVSLSSVSFLSVRDLIQLFTLSAVALLISVLGELVLAVVLMMLPLGFAAVLKALPFAFVLVAKTSAGQDLVVLLWAAAAGAFFVFGVGRHAWKIRARRVALIAGAISPWVVLGLARLEGHLWPSLRETSGPLDSPLMTLTLLVFALLTPWLAGRAARAGAQTSTAPQ